MVDIITFPYRGALMIFALNGLENGTALDRVAVLDTLLGFSDAFRPLPPTDSFGEDNLSGI